MEKRVSPLFTGYGGEPIVLMKWKSGFAVKGNYRAGSLCGLRIRDFWSGLLLTIDPIMKEAGHREGKF